MSDLRCRACGRSERRVGAGPHRGESVAVKVELNEQGVCSWCFSRYRNEVTFWRWLDKRPNAVAPQGANGKG